MATYRENLPAKFNELLDIWKEIRTAVGEQAPSEVEYYDHALSTGSWSWAPVFEHLDPDRVDRLGEVLLGPVYTSSDFPWPQEDGRPMIPLIQLDLDKASKTGGFEIGSGLLQAFVSTQDKLGQKILIRTIDRAYVSAETLVPPPAFDVDDETFASIDWVLNSAAPEDRLSIQIVGYEPKKFTFSGASQLSKSVDQKQFSAGDQEKIKRFDTILKDYKSDWSAGGFHLLGTFFPIQYKQEERSWPLFCLESDEGFNFGDGQGQVFFDTGKSGSRIFYFDWSCF